MSTTKKQLTAYGEALLRDMIKSASQANAATLSGKIPNATKTLDQHPLVYIGRTADNWLFLSAYTGRWGVGPTNDIAYGPGRMSGCETYIVEVAVNLDDAAAYAVFAQALENTPYPYERIVEGLSKWRQEAETQYVITGGANTVAK